MANNTLQTVAEQILTFNDNVVQLLTGINDLITSNSSLISFNVSDNNNNNNEFSLPSFGFMQSEINRLSNNINSFYNVSDSGALIQSSSNGSFRCSICLLTSSANMKPGAYVKFLKQ